MTRGWRRHGITTLSILATIVLTFVIGFVLLLWMQESSPDYVLSRTKQFSDVMLVVRPAILLMILLLWRPVFDLLHRRSIVTERTHERAMVIWPRLVVWIALIELTIGQGYLLAGLLSLAAYWAFCRLR